jgi:hypothetical protein
MDAMAMFRCVTLLVSNVSAFTTWVDFVDNIFDAVWFWAERKLFILAKTGHLASLESLDLIRVKSGAWEILQIFRTIRLG